MGASVTARTVALVCIACLVLGSGAAHGQGMLPPPAYQYAASYAGIPASVLFAVYTSKPQKPGHPKPHAVSCCGDFGQRN